MDSDSEIWPRGLTTTNPGNGTARMKGENCASTASSTAHLSDRQVERLRSVLSERVDIHGRGNFPTISIRLIDLIVCVREKLRAYGVGPRQVKMNGGAASYVVAADEFSYADLDLIFPISFEREQTFDLVRTAVFTALVELMPEETDKTRITVDTLKDIYIRKMVKVDESDRWSLFSLHNHFGRCIELKFVDKMRRQFEFSVDSFQITLDPLLDNFECPEIKVLIESVFGDIRMALEHLDQRLIDTRRPEEIRGGGLLKYCHLLTRGYKAARPTKCRQLERYMCSRFFIDFPDISLQESKLRNYLDNHFGSNYDTLSTSCGEDTDSEASTSQASSHPSLLSVQQSKYDFLLLLYRVISESTVCLMNHERRQTLLMVDRLAYQISMNLYHTRNSHDLTGGPQKQTLLYLPKDSSQWIPVI
ncbi:unnamed protein product, partial [Mesorhabditis belari]|uniref:polynucleotide adenylyltransferase n=1 Tax=Mesorhabditis belari TaxID=2138241 RepID=A0AAF3EHI2_9BILA